MRLGACSYVHSGWLFPWCHHTKSQCAKSVFEAYIVRARLKTCRHKCKVIGSDREYVEETEGTEMKCQNVLLLLWLSEVIWRLIPGSPLAQTFAWWHQANTWTNVEIKCQNDTMMPALLYDKLSYCKISQGRRISVQNYMITLKIARHFGNNAINARFKSQRDAINSTTNVAASRFPEI